VDLERVFLLRYLCILPVVASLLGSLLMFLIGVVKTLEAYSVFVRSYAVPTETESMMVNQTMVLIIRSADAFLIGFFLIIFAYGVYVLFLRKLSADTAPGPFPWLKMEGLDQLKTALAQLVIIILFVLFLEKVMASGPAIMKIEDIVLPAAILFLAAAKRMIRKE
jgi:uncharacterized membrane protein YqhA